MSLINQMLKDLEKRKHGLPNAEAVLSGLNTSIYSKPTINVLSYVWLVGGLFTLLFIFFIIVKQISFHLQQPVPVKTEQRLTISHAEAKAKIATAFAANSELPANPTSLTGITLQVENETTNLRLLLSQNVLYRILSNAKSQIILVLDNTRLETALPEINTSHSAIKLIRMVNQRDGSLKILFELNAGAELKHLELSPSAKPELLIDLSHKNNLSTDSPVEERQNNLIKTISYDTSEKEAYSEAINLSNQGQTAEAVKLLTLFLEKHPLFIPARKMLASLLMKQGNLTKARQVIDEGLQQQPLYPPYLQLKAQLLVDKGKIDEAIHLLQTSTPSLEDEPEYYALIAALYQQKHQFMLAEKLYERLVSVQPSNSIWWMGLGVARENLNKNADALEAYQRANTDSLSPELKIYVENRIRTLLS